MRNFSQRQPYVLFLFTGVKLFNQLEQPRWSDYLPHAKFIYLDYLSTADATQLLTQPYPNFPLQYADGVLAHIYTQTQGHPALLHIIGDALVSYANRAYTHDIDLNIVNQIIQTDILTQGQGVFTVFWQQFCHEQVVKDTVVNIIEQTGNLDRDSLSYLLQHRFIEKGTNRFQMRVPRFEQWIRKFVIDFLKF